MRAFGLVVLGSAILTSGTPARSTQQMSGERSGSVRVLKATPPEDQHPTKVPFTADGGGTFFAVSVEDLGASTRWYVETFDLKVSSQFSHGNIKGTLLAGRGLEIELVAHPESSASLDPFDPGKKVLARGIFKVGFRVRDFDATIAALRARGVQFVAGPFPARRDQRANAVMRDNAGNLIQLFGELAP